MMNLAGVPAAQSNPIVVGELTMAGVKAVETTFTKGRTPEVPATFVGILHFASGATVTFSRSWYYWSVHSSELLPHEPAKELNDRLGTIVRADGYSGGTNVGLRGCRNWHVDDQSGLAALVQVLKSHFGEEAADAPTISELAQRQLLNSAIYG